jgi:hypothetical protein
LIFAHLARAAAAIRARPAAEIRRFGALLVLAMDAPFCFAKALDLAIATYLGTDASTRRTRLAQNLNASGIHLHQAQFCTVDTSLAAALSMLEGSQIPLLVRLGLEDQGVPVGIVTPFDLL